MTIKVSLPPLKWWSRLLDIIFLPVMFFVGGAVFESPQRTHRWNNIPLRPSYSLRFKQTLGVHCLGDQSASSRWLGKFPLFHIPVLGGWRNYVVLEPLDPDIEWHVVWVTSEVFGASQLSVRGAIRLLIGPGDVSFYGVDAEGYQIKINFVGVGRIGKGGPFCQLPLL